VQFKKEGNQSDVKPTMIQGQRLEYCIEMVHDELKLKDQMLDIQRDERIIQKQWIWEMKTEIMK
jgi:hypothetical protein